MGNRRNTLGLREQELRALIREWDAQEDANDSLRRHARQSFLHDRVYVKVRQSSGSELILKMACRNLSSGGISLLHNAYVHPGAECTVVLEHRMEGPRAIEGRVVRCIHRVGVVHEIGVQFTSPIVVADFLGTMSPDEVFSFETIDPQDLEGVVLVVDALQIDFSLIQHYLKETRLRLRHARSVEEADTLLRDGLDVMILDLHIEDEKGADLLDRMRADGDETPVIATTIGLTPAMKPLISSLSNVRLLRKPFDEKRLLLALAEFMLQDLGSASMRVEKERIDTSVPHQLVDAFKNELQSMVDEIEKGLGDNDVHRCRVASLRIAGSAPSVGLATIGNLARQAADRLDAKGFDEAQADLRSLLDACRLHLAA